MPNKPISKEKREKIVNLSRRGYGVSGIANITNTSRPTVKKYQRILRERIDQ